MECPICRNVYEDCSCTFEDCIKALRNLTIDEVCQFALEHASMFATESACKKFVAFMRERKSLNA